MALAWSIWGYPEERAHLRVKHNHDTKGEGWRREEKETDQFPVMLFESLEPAVLEASPNSSTFYLYEQAELDF